MNTLIPSKPISCDFFFERHIFEDALVCITPESFHIYTHTYIQTYICAYMHTLSMHVHIHARAHTHTHTLRCAHVLGGGKGGAEHSAGVLPWVSRTLLGGRWELPVQGWYWGGQEVCVGVFECVCVCVCVCVYENNAHTHLCMHFNVYVCVCVIWKQCTHTNTWCTCTTARRWSRSQTWSETLNKYKFPHDPLPRSF
jgi:hypothetical protein